MYQAEFSKYCTTIGNKKVLLRDRKRHTAYRVASTRSASLARGGTPSSWPGVPQSYPGYTWLGLGCLPARTGAPPGQDWGTPWKGPGTRDLGKNL